MNYSQKVLFDDWIAKCPISTVRVEEPISMVRTEYGKWDYLVKVFLTIDKDDWDNNSKIVENPGIAKISEKSSEKSFEDDPQGHRKKS